MKDCGKCSGNCCEQFTFPNSLSELDRMIAAPIDEEFIEGDNGEELKVIRDPSIRQIRDMLIYIGPISNDPQGGLNFGKARNVDWSESSEAIIKKVREYNKDRPMGRVLLDLKNKELSRHSYTCKHFNSESRLCTNYENRPGMCSRFGVDSKCNYEGCTLKSDWEQLGEMVVGDEKEPLIEGTTKEWRSIASQGKCRPLVGPYLIDVTKAPGAE